MLRLRGRTYMSRTLVPASLQALLGRSEITKSLRTSDKREALRRLHKWEGRIDRLLTVLRRQGATMTREELDILVAVYTEATFDRIEDTLALEWSEAGLDQYRWDLNDRAHELAGALSHADPEAALGLAREMAPEAPEEVLRKLARRLMETQLRALKAELLALSGEPLDRPRGYGALLPTIPPVTPEAGPRLSELARQYGDERVARNSWTSRTEFQVRGYLTLLADMLGDPFIGDITKSDMRRFGLELTRLPSNMTKRFPGKTPREALEAAGDDVTVHRLAPNSVNAYLQAIRSFFNWAVEHDHISQSPAAILKNMETGRASEDRHPFNDADLRAYFQRLDAKRGRLPVEYWVPRIMAFTGCRLGEAAQLCSHDVRQEKGIWIIDINEIEDDKNLKTTGSRRHVPLHPRLIELGLPEFASAAAPGFLWPKEMRTNPNPTGSPIDKLQKRLAYVLRSAGIEDPKKTASHSFRHTVSSRLKALSVPEYQIAEILGHELGSMSTGRYGSVTDLATLKSVVQLIELPI